MKIQIAKYLARNYANKKTLIVDFERNIYANCNVDEVCKDLDKKKVKFHLLKGERTPKLTTSTKGNKSSNTEK